MKIFGVPGQWRRPHSVELHTLHHSTNCLGDIIKVDEVRGNVPSTAGRINAKVKKK